MAGLMAENPRHCSLCDEYANKADSITINFRDTGQAASFNLCDEHCETTTIGQLRAIAEDRRTRRQARARERRQAMEDA